MTYGDVYKKCQKLVMDYGWAKSPKTPKYMMYDANKIDGYDFQIYYDTVWESMNVFFGGREVYSFYKSDPNGEYLNSGHWIKMAQEIYDYEARRQMGDDREFNGVLLGICKREMARNREAMEKYQSLLTKLAESGHIKMSSGSGAHCSRYENAIHGHMVDVFLNEMPLKEASDYCSTVELKFDGRVVFVFRYNSNDKGGMLDEKGRYIPGKWEKIVEDLVN